MSNKSPEREVDWSPFVRPATTSDLEYVRSTWLSAYRTSPWAGCIPNNLYDAVYSETINQLCLRGTRILVVANPAAPEQLLSWLAYEMPTTQASQLPQGTPVVHFCFTKPTYRRLGCTSQLLASAGVVGSFLLTFRTPNSRFLKGAVFRPEVARRKELTRGS